METLSFKDVQQSIEYKMGLEEFRQKHNLKVIYLEAIKKLSEPDTLKLLNPQSVVYKWYRKVLTGKEYFTSYSKLGHTVLSIQKEGKDIKQVELAFLSIIESKDCLEITNEEDLMRIDRHRRVTNHYPFVTEDIRYEN